MENHADHLVNDYDHKKDYKWISQAIESLDPVVDYAEIWRLSTNYYIDDFVMNLIYTLGIPAFTQPPEGSIVMGVSTKKAVKQPQKRADDTLQHFWFWFEFGPDHPNMKASLAHVNLVHESLSKKNPNTFVKRDVIYTCCWIACMFHRLKLSLGLNGYSEKQKIATNIYWKKIVAMFWSEDGLLTAEDFPNSFDEMLTLLEKYEQEPWAKVESGKILTEAIIKQFLDCYFPTGTKWIGRQLYLSLQSQHINELMDSGRPNIFMKYILRLGLKTFLYMQENILPDPKVSTPDKARKQILQGQHKVPPMSFNRYPDVDESQINLEEKSKPNTPKCPFH